MTQPPVSSGPPRGGEAPAALEGLPGSAWMAQRVAAPGSAAAPPVELPAAANSPWAQASRILAIRLDNLGDILMTTPALRALRQQLPGRHIALLAGGAGLALAPFLPEVDEVIPAACPWMPGPAPTPAALAETVARLRAGRFDAAVIFTVYSQSALPAAMLCWQAGIPLRLAYGRENPYHLLTDWVADPEPHELLRHEVRRQLDLVARVGAVADDDRLSFAIPPQARERARARLAEAGIDAGRPYVVVHPGASAASRRYPPAQFAAALRRLAELSGLQAPQLVFTGDDGEVALVEEIRLGAGPSATLAGRLQLGELAAVLDDSALLLANNTGPVHLAAALGTPVVDLYALTNPQHAPWKTPAAVLYEDVPCRYCYRSVCPQGHHACLHLLAPERVAAAARRLLDEGAETAVAEPPAPPPLRPSSPLPPARPNGG
ncbi:glycosyltransferase family 9 protein [Azoarcus indigens]|uniref:Lipopolysaccharide heptosyltransferase II n=1 Tax=Azoarcus indigens TaxID=29545 RepID=A0A4R6DTJ5_9RHOO|nr:glycosyltransferase family 9 protein [Azoarcus indigens]TDN48427.1 lipopolysaccharide heptosyltransferase II [Azoarcus indigens]